MEKTVRRELVWLLLFIVVAAVILLLLSAIFMPKRSTYGALWDQYLAEEKNSMDMLYFGSSYMYCDISPLTIWQETGLTGFVLAGSEQTMPITYYYLREALKTQQPQAIVVDVSAVYFQRYEDYTAVNIGYMPMSMNKLLAIFKAAEPEERLGLLFSLYNYHDRWDQLTTDDWLMAVNGMGRDIYKGFMPLPANINIIKDERGKREVFADDQLYQENLNYIGKIISLCSEENIKPIFILAPALTLYQQQYRDQVFADIMEMADDICCYDFNNDGIAVIGIDQLSDYFDYGHLSAAGADKFSVYFCRYLDSIQIVPSEKPVQVNQSWQNDAESCWDSGSKYGVL